MAHPVREKYKISLVKNKVRHPLYTNSFITSFCGEGTAGDKICVYNGMVDAPHGVGLFKNKIGASAAEF